MKCEYCDGVIKEAPSKSGSNLTQISCPQCDSLSVSVVVEKRLANEYRLYRSIVAKLLTFLEKQLKTVDDERYGPECVCLQCGYRWRQKRWELTREYKGCLSKLLKGDPQLVVPTADGCVLNLDLQGVTVYKNKKYKKGIPYEQITQIDYQKSLGPLYGWLSIRHEGNRNKPFPVTFAQAKKDKTTFLCPFSYENTYLEMFAALQEIAQVNQRVSWHE